MKSVLTGATALLALWAAGLASVAAGQPIVGRPAPEFELADQDGRLHALEDYRDSWVVLYFYPKDGTPGCTTEACEFRDHIFAFRRMNARVLGVSLDDVDSHKSFAEDHGLPFPLLADATGTVADAYGVKTKRFGMTMAKRETFVIGPDGILARHYADVEPATHSAEILSYLRSVAATDDAEASNESGD